MTSCRKSNSQSDLGNLFIDKYQIRWWVWLMWIKEQIMGRKLENWSCDMIVIIMWIDSTYPHWKITEITIGWKPLHVYNTVCVN